MIALLLIASIHAQTLTAPQVRLYNTVPATPGPEKVTRPADTPPLSIRAAGGESEFFHLQILNDETEKTLETCSLVWEDDLEILTQTYRLKRAPGVEPRALPSGSEVLLPFAATPLSETDTCHLVVSLYVPPNTPRGQYSGHVALDFGDEGRAEHPVALEIFDFSLPARSSIPVLLGIDFDAIQKAYGLDASLVNWAAIYDLLCASRTGFEVWPRRYATGDIFYDDSDVPLIKEHLDYAVRAQMLPVVGIGGPDGQLLEQWPAPAFNTPQDPLQLLLYSLAGALETSGWRESAVLIPSPLVPRREWQRVRLACARVERADARFQSLIAAPAHPFFERYADIWALPGSTPTVALELIRRGLSLRRHAQPANASFQGSDGRMDPVGRYQTLAQDAFDGSETTAWYPDRVAGSEDEIPWLAVEFAALESVEKLAILWPPSVTPVLPEVETAYNPGSFSQATVRWDDSPRWTEGGQAISVGDLRIPRECIAIRLRFPPKGDLDFGVAEVLINRDGRTPANAKSEPAEPWLDLRSADSPFLAAERSALPLRLLPWFCWQRRFDGILGPVIGPTNGVDALSVHAGIGGASASLGLFQLRDGLEDFEYLNLYWKAVKKGEIRTPTDFSPGFYPVDLRGSGTESQAVLDRLHEERERMGRLLSGHSEVTTNFGPRKR